MKIKELNLEIVGNKLLSIPLLANQLGHKWLKSTANGYLFPDQDDLEGQFVKDLLTLDTETIIQTWYGGQDEAADLLFRLSGGEDNDN